MKIETGQGERVTELEQIRSVLREYLALEAEYKPIAEGWSHLRLRGAARKAWLKKTSARITDLRRQLSAFAEPPPAPGAREPRQCRACDGDGHLATDSSTPHNERLTRHSRVCTYCDGTGVSRDGTMP